MNVIGVASKVRLAAEGMLPISSLPQSKLAVAVALDVDARIKQAAAEVALDPAPAPWEIRVSFRKCEDRMEMIGQDHDGIDCKWPLVSGQPKRCAQRADVIDQSG